MERGSVDRRIIAHLGGEEKVPVSWADFKAALAEKERTGDLTWLIGYMKDKTGTLCAVLGFWSGGGWFVDADSSVGYPSSWDAGLQVLSRN